MILLRRTCPSYEFLVVFGQVWVWDRKSAGRARVEMVCGTVRVRRVRGGRGKIFSNFCGCEAGLNFSGAGRKRTKYFNLCRTLSHTH